jgi:uncharacterized protein
VSEENVEIVRRANALDWDSAFVFLDPDIEWVIAAEHPNARVLVGHEAVAEYQREWEETMPDVHFEVDRLLDAGDKVVGIGTVGGRGTESGADVSVPLAIVFTLRDGRIVRAEEFLSPAVAVKAAGLEE